MKKIILIVGALLLVGCGPSQKDKNIAAVTCAVMQETRNMDAAIRVEKMNDAREKIGGEPFLRGDDAIKEAFEWRLCQELVLNESYDETLQSLKDAERERARIVMEKVRIEAEKKRIEAEKQRIAAEKRAEERKIKEEQERVAREEREALELVGTLQNLLDNQLSRIKDIEDRFDSEVQRISDSGQQDIDLKQRQIRSLSLTITEITKSLDGGGLFSNNSAIEDILESERAARIKAEQELEEIPLKRDQDIEDYREH